MPSYSRPTYHSLIYRDFREIEGNAYHQIVRFFEEREEAIKQLDFDEYFEMLLAYTNALFEMGAYQKHLLMADAVIETTMENNIRLYRGEDVFRQMLFKKAASCFNLQQQDGAEHILKQMIRISPGDADAALFLRKCYIARRSALWQNSQATAIFLFLLAALVIAVELLVVRSFYTLHVPLVEMSRNSIFALGLLAMGGGYLGHRVRSHYAVRALVGEAQRVKRG